MEKINRDARRRRESERKWKKDGRRGQREWEEEQPSKVWERTSSPHSLVSLSHPHDRLQACMRKSSMVKKNLESEIKKSYNENTGKSGSKK